MYLNYAGNKLDAAENSPNAQMIGNVWHPEGQPILGDGSDPTIASGVSLDVLSEAMSRAVLWRDIDPNQVGDQSLAGEVLAAARAVTDADHGNTALKAAIDLIPTSQSGGGVTLTELQTVRDAIVSALRGTNASATLTGIASDIDGLADPATESELNAARDAVISALRGTNSSATLTGIVSDIDGLAEPVTETELNAVRDAILAAINPDIDGAITRNEMLRRIGLAY